MVTLEVVALAVLCEELQRPSPQLVVVSVASKAMAAELWEQHSKSASKRSHHLTHIRLLPTCNRSYFHC